MRRLLACLFILVALPCATSLTPRSPAALGTVALAGHTTAADRAPCPCTPGPDGVCPCCGANLNNIVVADATAHESPDPATTLTNADQELDLELLARLLLAFVLF